MYAVLLDHEDLIALLAAIDVIRKQSKVLPSSIVKVEGKLIDAYKNLSQIIQENDGKDQGNDG